MALATGSHAENRAHGSQQLFGAASGSFKGRGAMRMPVGGDHPTDVFRKPCRRRRQPAAHRISA
ncbi:MAG TPA: hypothetical protein VMV99_10700 [Rhodanobacter sp.]|nr:hypothetical protein [Rhodanobacter sp.]